MKKRTIVIIGLGNPEDKYTNTRHNVGFKTLDNFLHSKISKNNTNTQNFSANKKMSSLIVSTKVKGINCILAKPTTYMNKSGFAVKSILDFYKLKTKDLLVVHDDIDLPFGLIRLSKNSGSAGHKGVTSIINELGSKNFNRLRIGIQSSENNQAAKKIVLKNFSKNESALLKNKIIPLASSAIKDLIEKGFSKSANIHNKKSVVPLMGTNGSDLGGR